MRKFLAPVFALLLFHSPARSDVDPLCSNPQHVALAVGEILNQLKCSSAKMTSECAKILGIGVATAGAVLSSPSLAGAIAKRVAVGSTLTSRETPSGARPAETLRQDVLRIQSRAVTEVTAQIAAQTAEMEKQLFDIAQSVKNSENIRGTAATADGAAKAKDIERRYQAAVKAIDISSRAEIATNFKALVERDLPIVKGQMSSPNTVKAHAFLKALGYKTEVSKSAQYARYMAIDELAEILNLRRSDGTMLIGENARDPLIRNAEAALQKRTAALVKLKQAANLSLGEIQTSASSNSSRLIPELTDVDRYELKKMAFEKPSTSSIGGKFDSNVFNARHPLLAQDLRATEGLRVLSSQAEQLNELKNSATAVSASVRNGVAGVNSATSAVEVLAPIDKLPPQSAARLERDILAARYPAGSTSVVPTELSPEQLARFGGRELTSQAISKLTTRELLGIAGRGLGRVASVAGLTLAASDATGLVLRGAEWATGRDDLNCTPCGKYLALDLRCNPSPGLDSKTLSFLNLSTEQQIQEMKACPGVCQNLIALREQISPVANWKAQCTAPGEKSGYTLAARTGVGEIKFSDGTPTSRVRFEKFESMGASREVILNDGIVTSVRLAKMGIARSQEAAAKVNELSNPQFYKDVTRSAMEKPRSHYDRQARDTTTFVDRIRYAQTEVQACCAIESAGRRPEDMPSARRCVGYLGETPLQIGNRSNVNPAPASSGGPTRK